MVLCAVAFALSVGKQTPTDIFTDRCGGYGPRHHISMGGPMIFSGLEYLDKIPFDDVYIYATVMNEENKRMSKSLGTGVDPLGR